MAELTLRTLRLTPLYNEAIRVFSWGFRIGGALLVLGVVLALITGEPLQHEADRISNVPAQVLAGKASAVIDLAILWFMALPVITVIVAGFNFWRLGDRRYAILSLVVLIILGASIALALRR